MVLECRPTPPLSSYVEKLWYCEGYQAAHRRERVLPDGRFQLVIDLAEGSTQRASALVIGVRSSYTVIETARLQLMMGVLFWPGGARPFFDPPANEFYNRAAPLDLFWGSMAAEMRDRLRESPTPAKRFQLLESILQRRIQNRLELHAAVRYGLGEFRHVPHIRRVLEVARDAGLSRRRFALLFREQIGLTPKLYCRLRRFQQVVRQVAAGAPVDWADVALAGGYCDQAHLAHEFRDFSGFSPGVYQASERPFLNHVAMD